MNQENSIDQLKINSSILGEGRIKNIYLKKEKVKAKFEVYLNDILVLVSEGFMSDKLLKIERKELIEIFSYFEVPFYYKVLDYPDEILREYFYSQWYRNNRNDPEKDWKNESRLIKISNRKLNEFKETYSLRLMHVNKPYLKGGSIENSLHRSGSIKYKKECQKQFGNREKFILHRKTNKTLYNFPGMNTKYAIKPYNTEVAINPAIDSMGEEDMRRIIKCIVNYKIFGYALSFQFKKEPTKHFKNYLSWSVNGEISFDDCKTNIEVYEKVYDYIFDGTLIFAGGFVLNIMTLVRIILCATKDLGNGISKPEYLIKNFDTFLEHFEYGNHFNPIGDYLKKYHFLNYGDIDIFFINANDSLCKEKNMKKIKLIHVIGLYSPHIGPNRRERVITKKLIPTKESEEESEGESESSSSDEEIVEKKLTPTKQSEEESEEESEDTIDYFGVKPVKHNSSDEEIVEKKLTPTKQSENNSEEESEEKSEEDSHNEFQGELSYEKIMKHLHVAKQLYNSFINESEEDSKINFGNEEIRNQSEHNSSDGELNKLEEDFKINLDNESEEDSSDESEEDFEDDTIDYFGVKSFKHNSSDEENVKKKPYTKGLRENNSSDEELEEQFEDAIYEENIKKSYNSKSSRTRNSITLNRKVQFILRLYSDIEQVLMGFDIAASSVGFDGKDFFMTPLAEISLRNRVIIPFLDQYSTSTTYRICKYAKHKNFSIYIPGVSNINKYVKVGNKGLSAIANWYYSDILPRKISDYSNVNVVRDDKSENYKGVDDSKSYRQLNTNKLGFTIVKASTVQKGEYTDHYRNGNLIKRQKEGEIIQHYLKGSIYSNTLNDCILCFSDIEQSFPIEWKTFNPGEQLTGSFEAMVYEDPSVWYHNNFPEEYVIDLNKLKHLSEVFLSKASKDTKYHQILRKTQKFKDNYIKITNEMYDVKPEKHYVNYGRETLWYKKNIKLSKYLPDKVKTIKDIKEFSNQVMKDENKTEEEKQTIKSLCNEVFELDTKFKQIKREYDSFIKENKLTKCEEEIFRYILKWRREPFYKTRVGINI